MATVRRVIGYGGVPPQSFTVDLTCAAVDFTAGMLRITVSWRRAEHGMEGPVLQTPWKALGERFRRGYRTGLGSAKWRRPLLPGALQEVVQEQQRRALELAFSANDATHKAAMTASLGRYASPH